MILKWYTRFVQYVLLVVITSYAESLLLGFVGAAVLAMSWAKADLEERKKSKK